ncbi:hypothetical protein [uncultured Dysosmobacter sp.]|uniref:hypothetical protein n=1 Tax=uncultured Dysosmobacter sp. TaxID=2591384 RepID=UPI002634A0A6|nr:hypothetical protein [uncultured Dysosmobacter sp.]
MNAQEEALKIWKYLEPMVEKKIQETTANTVRRKKFTVASAPNGTTMGVKEAGSSTVIHIPYVSTLSEVTAGATVWCEWVYGMSNLIAVSTGSGQQGSGQQSTE